MPIPKQCITVRTYQEFIDDVQRFKNSHFRFLIVLGNPGISKTQTIHRILGNCMIYSGGRPTAYQFYCDLYFHRNEFVILDDLTPKFYMDHVTNSMLKILTDSVETKIMQWNTAKTNHDESNVPASFATKSRVVIIANDWESVGKHIQALESRAYMVHFAPTMQEIHHQVAKGGWFKDQEIYDWIWEHRYLMDELDMRLYAKLLEQKQAGADWKSRGLQMFIGNDRTRQVIELLEDPALTTNNQRSKRFMDLGYGARSTFYECLKHLKHYNEKDDTTKSPNLADYPAAEPDPEPEIDDPDPQTELMEPDESKFQLKLYKGR